LALGLWGWSGPVLADLKQAKDAYDFGDYAKAIRELEPLLYPSSQLEEEEDEAQAHKILGASYFLTGDREGARNEFEVLLGLRPEETLDPFKFPPEMRSLFEGLKREIAEGKAVLVRSATEKRFATAVGAGAALLAREEALTPKFYAVVVKQRSPALSFVPFVGQLQNGDYQRAAALLAAEALTVGASVGTFLYLQRFTGAPDPQTGQVPCFVGDLENLGLTGPEVCSLMRTLNLTSVGLSVALLGAGVFDARRRFVPREVALEEVPPEVGRRLKQSTTKPAKPRVAPVVGPGGASLVVSFSLGEP
jgi:hypothetical protein